MARRFWDWNVWLRMVTVAAMCSGSAVVWAQGAAYQTPGQPVASPWVNPQSAVGSPPATYSSRPSSQIADTSPLSPPVSEFDRPPLPAPMLRSVVPSDTPTTAPADRPLESSWYTRIDYFHWNERADGSDFVNESGPLITLGYVRRNGPERFRAELFGGDVTYKGGAQFEDGSFEAYTAGTNYLGCRGEYDLLFQPAVWPNTLFFLGVGSRFWFRDLPDAVTPSGAGVQGYQETWWTIYPYLGMEFKQPLSFGPELYGAGRVGVTAITYEHATFNDAILYPKPDMTGQVEMGLRSRSLSVAAFFETMNWRASALVRDSYQPDSRMYTLGGRFAYRF